MGSYCGPDDELCGEYGPCEWHKAMHQSRKNRGEKAMAKDDFNLTDYGLTPEAKAEDRAARQRQKVGPMRRTHRPAASAEVQQALDAQLLEAHGLALEDQEKRLRDLEAFKWKLMGACLAAGGMGAGLAKLLGG